MDNTGFTTQTEKSNFSHTEFEDWTAGESYLLGMLSDITPGGEILVDSGAELNASPTWHAKAVTTGQVPKVRATTATGGPATHHGEKTVEYLFPDGAQGP